MSMLIASEGSNEADLLDAASITRTSQVEVYLDGIFQNDSVLPNQDLQGMLVGQNKISPLGKEKLVKSNIEFDRSNERSKKSSQFCTRRERKAYQMVFQYKRQNEILKERNGSLQMLGNNRVKTIGVVANRIQNMLGLGQVSIGEKGSHIQNSQQDSFVDFSKQSPLILHLENLERLWSEVNHKLKQQIECNLSLQSQVKLLREQLKTSEEDCHRLKKRTRMMEQIVKMAEKDKRKLNEEIQQHIEQNNIQGASVKELRMIVGSLKLEQKQLKRRNQDLLREVSKLMDKRDDRVESMMKKIDMLENQRAKNRQRLKEKQEPNR